METPQLRRLLDCRLIQHQHVDDRRQLARGGLVLVASLALCVDRLFHCWLLRGLDRSHRRDVSHLLSSGQSSIFWHLGLILACSESSGDGVVCLISPTMQTS